MVLCGLVWSQFDQTLTLVAWHAVSISIGFQCRFSVSVGEEPREGICVNNQKTSGEEKSRQIRVFFVPLRADGVVVVAVLAVAVVVVVNQASLGSSNLSSGRFWEVECQPQAKTETGQNCASSVFFPF